MVKTMKRSKRSGVNKSQAIRDILARLGADARPRDVKAELAKQGISVSPALVTNVFKRNRTKRRGRPPGSRSFASAGESISMSALLEAKKLVNQVGSIDDAKRALDALSRLI